MKDLEMLNAQEETSDDVEPSIKQLSLPTSSKFSSSSSLALPTYF